MAMTRDADVDELRQLIAKLRQELSAKEMLRDNAGSASDELEIEIFQRRRYLDELLADLHDLSTAPLVADAPLADAPADAMAAQGLAIVIGHSSEGTDKGASGLSPPFPNAASDGRAEYFWNQDLAGRIEAIATARGIRVKTFRRRQNGGPGIREAYRLVAQWKPQASVELHFNAAGPTARGSETLFGRSGSRPWARALQDKLVALYGRTGSQDRGLKDANVEGRGVLSLTNEVQPSALIEPFFGSNSEDALLGISRKDGLAAAVVNAFATFVGLPVP
jgi:N-acetylmuramoyl-L-alanine amidase